jgi:3',5'-cyclic AMP phosphodiesterase CpdA
MKSGRVITTLLLLCILHGISISQKKSQYNPYFFIQITDPQFGMFENNEGFEKETVLYEKAVAEINKLNPDFVVITGDFVHDPKADSQIKEFKRITAKINPEIPVYYTPGNHDVGQEPDKQSLRKYNNSYGYEKFAFKHKGSWFIGFNSSLIKSNLPKHEQKQYKWLKKALEKSQEGTHVVLFCHYPFIIKAFDEPETYSNIGPENREKYLSLFETNQVDAVFSGHLHNNAVTNHGEIEWVTTSAIGKPLGDAPSGMRIVIIYKDRIEHTFFGLDEIPDSVHLIKALN